MTFLNDTFTNDGGDIDGQLPVSQGVVLQALHRIRVQPAQEGRWVLDN